MEEFTISNWIALASVGLSLIALVKSFLTDRKAKKLDLLLMQQQVQKHDEEIIECKKADIEVNVVEMPRGSNNKLKFYNRGKAIAYNVKFKITSDTGANIQLFMDKNYLPFPKLLPQQSFDIVYIQFSHEPHHTILMTWDDDFCKGQSKEMVVDM